MYGVGRADGADTQRTTRLALINDWAIKHPAIVGPGGGLACLFGELQ